MTMMFRLRVLASRKAWLKFRWTSTPEAKARYERVVAYECRRNKTERYTPYWQVMCPSASPGLVRAGDTMAAPSFGRCDYCYRPATVRFSWKSRLVTRGHVRALTIHRQACSEHEGCANWSGMRALHPYSPIERITTA